MGPRLSVLLSPHGLIVLVVPLCLMRQTVHEARWLVALYCSLMTQRGRCIFQACEAHMGCIIAERHPHRTTAVAMPLQAYVATTHCHQLLYTLVSILAAVMVSKHHGLQQVATIPCPLHTFVMAPGSFSMLLDSYSARTAFITSVPVFFVNLLAVPCQVLPTCSNGSAGSS